MKKLIVITVAAVAALSGFAGMKCKVLAFYPFKDGAPGTSLTSGSITCVTNAVDASLYRGTVTKYGEGDILFSDERPGKYLFHGGKYRASADEAYYTEPGSLYFVGSANKTNDSCRLFFNDIATTLQNIGDEGTPYVIEFFYKLDEGYTYYGTVNAFFAWEGNWMWKNTGARNWMQVYLRAITESQNAFYITGGYGTLDDGIPNTDAGTYHYAAGQCSKDGRWHHMLVTWPPPQGDSISSGLLIPDKHFLTGGSCTRVPYYYTGGTLEGNHAIVLNSGRRFKGWISGLRVLELDKDARAASHLFITNVLWASNLPTCVPKTITHLRFDELAADAALASGSAITNMADNYATVNTQMFCNANAEGRWSGNEGHAQVAKIGVWGVETGDASATATNGVWKKCVLDGAARTSPKLANVRALALPGASGYGSGVAVPYQNHVILNDTDEYTCEMFFRFDRARYEAQQAAGAGGTSPISLMWYSYGTTSRTNTWALVLNVEDLDNPKLEHFPDSNIASRRVDAAPGATNGKWHHVALTISRTGDGMTCYYDYGKLRSCVNGFSREDVDKERSFLFGSGDHAAAFPGDIDEMRVSWGVLTPDQFLHARNMDGLQLLIK